MRYQQKKYHPELSLPRSILPCGQTKRVDTEISDHVALLLMLEIPHAQLTPMKIITWNVQEKSTDGSGFAPLMEKPEDPEYILEWKRKTTSAGETIGQTNERHTRIVEALKKMVDVCQPSFITLQEISNKLEENEKDDDGYEIEKKKPSFLKNILSALGEDWDYMPKESPEIAPGVASGNITFFKKSIVTSQQTIKIDPSEQKELCPYVVKFLLNGVETPVEIWNVHADFNAKLPIIEKMIKTIIQRSENTTTILAGDFNHTIAPTNTAPQNIITSTSPSYFRDGQIQGAYAIDGGFYSSCRDGRIECQQAASLHLSRTDETYLPHKLEINTIDENMSFLQKKEIETLRPVLSIGANTDFNIPEQIRMMGSTVLEFNEKLKTIHGENVFFSYAVNNNNARGFVIQLNHELYARLKLDFKKNNDFQFNEKEKSLHIFKNSINISPLLRELMLSDAELLKIKNTVCGPLKKYTSCYKLSIFGHHHDQRASAVIKVIMQALR